MLHKALTNGPPFRDRYVVLHRPLGDVSNRLLLAYCCLGIVLLPLYQFQIDPDGISYMNIAHLYASGDFHDAVNGYWGPLFSWLLVPFLRVKFQPLLASKVLALLIGFCTLLALRKLSYRFALNDQVRMMVFLAAIPMLLAFTFIGLSGADLLLLCTSLSYFSYIFDADYSKKATQGCIIGVLGALMFFSKSYGLYFFLVSFSLFTCISFFKSKNRQEHRNVVITTILGLLIFLILSGIWIYFISQKYQHFTISSSGVHNMQLDSIGSRGQPMLYQGLLPLSYPAAVSAWDDPTYLTIGYEKSPRLFEQLTFQFIHSARNVLQTLHYFELFSIFSLLVIAIFAMRVVGSDCAKGKGALGVPGEGPGEVISTTIWLGMAGNCTGVQHMPS